MGMDDVFSTGSVFVAAVTATVFSSKTRETARKGGVYGVAGALKVGDVMAGAARGAVRGIRGDEAAVNGAGKTAVATTRSTGSSSRRRTTSSNASTRRAATARSGGDASDS